MRFVLFTHSITSDWNHGNAHFLRGILRALHRAGHQTLACEPEAGWSLDNLRSEPEGARAIAKFADLFPEIAVQRYGADPDLDALLDGADVVIVHEWTDPALVAAIGRMRRTGGRFTLLFHDTHHRAVSAESQIAGLDLEDYDAVLAFGAVLSETYRTRGWGQRVFTWHEAADTELFRPHPDIAADRDLVFIGNWGDEERSDELRRFLVGPSARLKLRTTVHGVRYPAMAIEALSSAGIAFEGYLPNLMVPQVLARHRATIHVPRGPYVRQLPGIPTIRVFEALASGIALISAPWSDSEGLFRPGCDFLIAKDGEDMERQLRQLMADAPMRQALAASGRARVLERHSCRHRVDELLAIVAKLACRHRGGRGMRIAFYGSSLTSSYWNGAATYYRGIIRALAGLGYDVTFYEPDAYDRQKNRDIEPPPWCRVVVYPATIEGVQQATACARHADIVVKASGVGVFDDELLAASMAAARDDALRIFGTSMHRQPWPSLPSIPTCR